MTEGINTFWITLLTVILFASLALHIIIKLNVHAANVYSNIIQKLPFLNFLSSSVLKKILDILAEPLHYIILLIRKPYNDSIRHWIVYSCLTIVAFYFILTIF